MELTKMCRVCLLPQDEIDLLDWHKLVDSLEYRLTYKECFCKCTQINISLKEDRSDEDSQTQYLCFFCAQSLKDAYEFIKRARKADDELRSRQLDNSFEWVAVSAKDVEIEEDTIINEKEDITTANLNEESYEIYLIENTKSENEELMNSPEIESDDDGPSKKRMKKFQTRNNDSKAGSRKSKNDEINMDEMEPCDVCQKVMTRRSLVKYQHRHKPKTFLCQSCYSTQKRFDTLTDILAEHKILLNRIFTQNAKFTSRMTIFPINSEENLKEFDDILSTQPDPYIRQIKVLLAGNAERNLHHVFGHGIIMAFNVDGSLGKKRLRDYTNVFTAMIDVISTFSEFADKTLRAAFQRQKKKYFKQTSRNNKKQRVVKGASSLQLKC